MTKSAQPCARSFKGDTREVGGPGPMALPSSRILMPQTALPEPRLHEFVYEVPGVNSIAYHEEVKRC